jgi:hypothetical protein
MTRENSSRLGDQNLEIAAGVLVNNVLDEELTALADLSIRRFIAKRQLVSHEIYLAQNMVEDHARGHPGATTPGKSNLFLALCNEISTEIQNRESGLDRKILIEFHFQTSTPN